MAWIAALIEILGFIRETGGVKKFASMIDRFRDEALQMRKDLPKPGRSKGY